MIQLSTICEAIERHSTLLFIGIYIYIFIYICLSGVYLHLVGGIADATYTQLSTAHPLFIHLLSTTLSTAATLTLSIDGAPSHRRHHEA